MTLFGGEKEEIRTVIIEGGAAAPTGTIPLTIESALRIKSRGFVKRFSGKSHTLETLEFEEYFHPVRFFAYYSSIEQALIFQAPKDVCKDVSKIIRDNPADFEMMEVTERQVDFDKIGQYVNEFFSTWFRGISAEVRSANLTGVNIQDDPYFKEFLKRGVIKNVIIPLEFENIEHRVMVTEHAAVVLVDDYRNDTILELSLVLEAKKKIIEKLWIPVGSI
jgi:hypothetical protein